jgi:hypothetical protein
MKTKIIILLSFFLCYSCNKKVEQQSKPTSISKEHFDNSIVGSWQMCKIISNGVETSYNVCPTVVFYQDGKGSVKSAEKTACDFEFITKSNKIFFSFKSLENKRAFFANGTEFTFNSYIKNDIEFVQLNQLNTDYKFILSRIVEKR